jgi:CBS domain-containing protein
MHIPAGMDVGELCNREVVICQPELSLFEAAQLMRKRHVGCLVVVEQADGNEPCGLVTDRDLVVDGIATAPNDLASLTVAQVMTSELVTARESEDVATVLARMKSFGVRRVPVVDEAGQLQGIVAYDDLVEWIAEQLSGLPRIVRSELRVEKRRFNVGQAISRAKTET